MEYIDGFSLEDIFLAPISKRNRIIDHTPGLKAILRPPEEHFSIVISSRQISFVSKTGRAVLTDFGITNSFIRFRNRAVLHRTGTYPATLPPEQIVSIKEFLAAIAPAIDDLPASFNRRVEGVIHSLIIDNSPVFSDVKQSVTRTCDRAALDPPFFPTSNTPRLSKTRLPTIPLFSPTSNAP